MLGPDGNWIWSGLGHNERVCPLSCFLSPRPGETLCPRALAHVRARLLRVPKSYYTHAPRLGQAYSLSLSLACSLYQILPVGSAGTSGPLAVVPAHDPVLYVQSGMVSTP